MRRVLEGIAIVIIISVLTYAWSGTIRVWNLENAVKDIQTKVTSMDSKLNKITCRIIPGGLDCDP